MKQLKHLDAFLAQHARKVMSADEEKQVKRFVKAYHEIKFNLDKNKYVPNFDSFTLEEKKAQIVILRPKHASNLDDLSEKEINDLFQDSVGYEVVGLEKDMMEVFS
jgi:RNA-directed DNA polymerase